MPLISYNDNDTLMSYTIDYGGVTYQPDEVLHFALNPHPYYSYRGIGYRVAITGHSENLTQTSKTKTTS